MFMKIAIGAIGIGIALMIGYLVIGQVRSTMPEVTFANGTVDPTFETEILGAQTTIFAGFALVGVGIIVVAAFGMISLFK